MTHAPAFAGAPRGNPLRRAEAWLDARGRTAWIVAMVAGFVVFWPIGLALVLYMTATGKWGLTGRTKVARTGLHMSASTGNAAFDSYRNETLRRLEEEQAAFEKFLERLREAKDKAEFDQFMEDRAKRREETRDDQADAA